jgi:hypothetical protein
MRRRSPSPVMPADLPVHLRHVFRAAARECPKGHASALRDLTALAVMKVPARGIFDPTSRGEQDLFAAIEAIANRHLGRTRARATWGAAVRRARLQLEARDRIERAALQVQGVSDTAYFYAGLAFGLTWISVYRDH